MRYAIIGDIHANLAAFTAVLDDIKRQGGADNIWCLGDIVGYGPDPHECVELLRQLKHVCVAGNHDLAAIGKVDTVAFNPDAAAACHWTSRQLTTSDVEYLGNLRTIVVVDDFTLVHGSPREPVWEYLISTGIARENFSRFKSQFCLVGHSHIPLVFIRDEKGNCSASQFSPNVKLALGDNRMIINPGSVGQPRDGDPQARYAIYDSQNRLIRLFRVPYDIEETQNRMVERGLPMRLVARLSQGI
jgi:diadenosine tetraphosphatase ApaH/serine/threonine PP2A family protein phosphatase